MFSPSEDKGALAKLVEAIKTNYNDRCEEVSIWSVSLWLKFNNLRKKLHNFNCFTNSLPRSAVTGEAASWVPNPQLASTSWRRQRPRNWQPSLVKMFGIKKCPNRASVFITLTVFLYRRQIFPRSENSAVRIQ